MLVQLPRGRNRAYCSASCRSRQARRTALAQKYSLTEDSYAAMLIAQLGKCAICQEEETLFRFLHVDHNHATGKVRQLLCSGCNTGLAAFREDPERLLSAAAYLDKHRPAR